MPQRIIVRNTQCPGDHVVLSGAVRDVLLAHPGRFEIMMDTVTPEVFSGNPRLTRFPPNTGKRIVAGYGAIHRSNQEDLHFLWGFIEDLNKQLETHAVLTDFRGDLHLSEQEKRERPRPDPYWIFASGGKRDYITKWWDPDRWQQVVDGLRGKVDCVQVGGGSHVHPPVRGAIDLVGRTTTRELLRLIYHAEGVLCVVTSLMHIAAAFHRPAVVVAGGREAPTWEAYTAENRLRQMRRGIVNWKPPAAGDTFIPHRFLHSIGKLDCCLTGGCWKSLVELPVAQENNLRDRNKLKKAKEKVCRRVVDLGRRRLPQCLHDITADEVLANVEWYYREGILQRRTGAVVSIPDTPAPEVLVRLDEKSDVVEHIQSAGAGTGIESGLNPDTYPDKNPPPGLFPVVWWTAGATDAWWRELRTKRPDLPWLVVTEAAEGPDWPAERIRRQPAGRGRTAALAAAVHLLPPDADRLLWLEAPLLIHPGADLACKGLGGVLYRRPWLPTHRELLATAAWKPTDFNPEPWKREQRVCAPAFRTFTAPAEWLRKIAWPDIRPADNDLELLLAVAAGLYGLPVEDVGGWFEGY